MKRVEIVKEQYYYVGPCMNKQLIRHENGMGMNGALMGSIKDMHLWWIE